MKHLVSAATGCVALLVLFAGVASADHGATVYKQICASCHETGLERAPDRDALRTMSPERVLASVDGQ
jgi:cytochrome c5